MPDNNYLWRAHVAGIAKPVYLVQQNMPSALAAIASHPEVDPADVLNVQRIDLWDEPNNMTKVRWPEPPPPPEPEEPTIP